MNGDITFHTTGTQFMVDDTGTYVGLRFAVCEGYSPSLETITIPLNADMALEVGAQLIAHSDAIAGRPVRDWSRLAM